MRPRSLRVLGAALPAAIAVFAAPPATPQTTSPPSGILCLNKAGADYVVKAAPRNCAAFGPSEVFAGGVNLKRLRWKNWGSPLATARGIECGFHLPCERIKAKVTAFAPEVSCNGQVVYTRIRAKTRFGQSRVPAHSCPGPVAFSSAPTKR
jgi:hypothetical protein